MERRDLVARLEERRKDVEFAARRARLIAENAQALNTLAGWKMYSQDPVIPAGAAITDQRKS